MVMAVNPTTGKRRRIRQKTVKDLHAIGKKRFDCGRCGLSADRDLNGARNIFLRFLELMGEWLSPRRLLMFIPRL